MSSSMKVTYNDSKLKGIVDMTLTPENARKRGFKYIDDVLYEVFAISDSINDIFQLAKDQGCKLGIPSPQNDFEHFYGLYMPVDTVKISN